MWWIKLVIADRNRIAHLITRMQSLLNYICQVFKAILKVVHHKGILPPNIKEIPTNHQYPRAQKIFRNWSYRKTNWLSKHGLLTKSWRYSKRKSLYLSKSSKLTKWEKTKKNQIKISIVAWSMFKILKWMFSIHRPQFSSHLTKLNLVQILVNYMMQKSPIILRVNFLAQSNHA